METREPWSVPHGALSNVFQAVQAYRICSALWQTRNAGASTQITVDALMSVETVEALFPAGLRGQGREHAYMPAAVSRERIAPSRRWIHDE